jgi:hypothetical protein
MRKITVLLALLAVAAMPSAADAAKKSRKKVAAQPAAQTANPNENSARFVRDAVPVFLPSWAIPIYLSQQTQGPHAYWYRQQQQQQQQQQARKARRVKQAKQ